MRLSFGICLALAASVIAQRNGGGGGGKNNGNGGGKNNGNGGGGKNNGNGGGGKNNGNQGSNTNGGGGGGNTSGGRPVPPRGQVQLTGATVENEVETLSIAKSEGTVDTGGTGCKSGSVVSQFNPDSTILTLIFNSFTANIAPGATRNERRRFCGVDVGFKVPANWTFEVENLDFRGYIDIDGGVRAVLRSTYFWKGQKNQQARFRKVINGPVAKELTATSEKGVKEGSTGALPCSKGEGSTLHVNTVVMLCYDGQCNGQGKDGAKANQIGKGAEGGEKGSGRITVDSVDGKFKQELDLGWKQCT